MKFKLFFTALAAVAITATSFAKGPETANAKAQSNLTEEFKDAKNIDWTTKGALTEATFEWNGQKLQAFYTQDGDQVALSRQVAVDQLPVKALHAIKNRYSDYTTTEAIEFNNTDTGLSYYVSMEKGNKKTILNVSPDGLVSVFK